MAALQTGETMLRFGLMLVLATGLAIFARCDGAAAEVTLYPHAEQASGPWGYIDKTGKIVIPLQFVSALPFSEGLAAVEVRGTDGNSKRYGFIDRTGALVIPARFMKVQPVFRSGRAAVKMDTAPSPAWGLIDRDGKLIVPAI
jgi:hypothetical protein